MMVTTLNIEILFVALGNEITSIGSEVTKAVVDSVDKKAQGCIQSGSHQLKILYMRINSAKFFIVGIKPRSWFF